MSRREDNHLIIMTSMVQYLLFSIICDINWFMVLYLGVCVCVFFNGLISFLLICCVFFFFFFIIWFLSFSGIFLRVQRNRLINLVMTNLLVNQKSKIHLPELIKSSNELISIFCFLFCFLYFIIFWDTVELKYDLNHLIQLTQ